MDCWLEKRIIQGGDLESLANGMNYPLMWGIGTDGRQYLAWFKQALNNQNIVLD